MNDEVRKNILYVLESLKSMLLKNEIVISDLKMLSNSVMEDVSLFHDRDSILIGVLVYSLYKIFSRNSGFDKRPLKSLIQSSIKKIDSEVEFHRSIRSIFDQINKYDKNVDQDILSIVEHAQIKKGLKVYEHGISIGQAAEIIGVSKWSIMEYLGRSDVIDKDPNMRVDQKTRLLFARSLFRRN